MSFAEENHAYAQTATASENGQTDGVDVQPPDTGNIDKIREILFGGQMRDYDRRFSRVEERLIKESADLREDTKKRFETLESFIKSEFTALSERLQSEHRTRDEAVQGLWRGLHETGHALNGKLAELQDNSTRAQSDLREQILEQSKQLNEEIRRKQEEVTSLLQQEVADLNHGKTDRSGLALLFTEMALRLNNDLKKTATN